MATKHNYYFEIRDTDKIFGGIYYDSTPMTEYQAYSKAIRMGRDCLRNSPDINHYYVDVTTGDDAEDMVFSVSVNRHGRALDARVWDYRVKECIYDSQQDRISKVLKQCDDHLAALGYSLD